MNIILDDSQRIKHHSIIAEMHAKFPEMMSRKIERANVQQAWMLNIIRGLSKTEDMLLSVGCYEDTAYEMLRRDGFAVVGIDPEINSDIETFAMESSLRFDIVFSTSVIEHVSDDEQFLTSIIKVLKPGGFGVFTCDFNDKYPNVPKPIIDKRLYTVHDLTVRIPNLLERLGCKVEGEADYSGNIDFEYEGCQYAFATFVFSKNT